MEMPDDTKTYRMKKYILSSVLCFLAVVLSGVEAFAQQDAQYSQYMFNQLALNPAYAGSREALATSLVYRNQWTGIDGAPTTGAVAVQMPLKKKKIGVGAEIFSDKLGPKNTSGILFSYAYRIPFLKGKLSFGLRMGMYNYAFDWTKMDYKDKSDVYNQIQERKSKITPTADFGMYYYARTFYWGFATTHLNRGKITTMTTDSTAHQEVHYFIPIGKAFEVKNMIINPSVLIKAASNAPPSVDVSVNLLLKERLWLGVSARSKYGILFLAQYMINEKMKAGYSYDLGTNKIGIVGKGSHEIMIGYDINLHGTKMVTPRYL